MRRQTTTPQEFEEGHRPHIWIDHFGRFFDAFDHFAMSVNQMKYVLDAGNEGPHFRVPALREEAK